MMRPVLRFASCAMIALCAVLASAFALHILERPMYSGHLHIMAPAVLVFCGAGLAWCACLFGVPCCAKCAAFAKGGK